MKFIWGSMSQLIFLVKSKITYASIFSSYCVNSIGPSCKKNRCNTIKDQSYTIFLECSFIIKYCQRQVQKPLSVLLLTTDNSYSNQIILKGQYGRVGWYVGHLSLRFGLTTWHWQNLFWFCLRWIQIQICRELTLQHHLLRYMYIDK